MNEPDWRNCTEEQLWNYVACHLADSGIESVLVGGAVVSIYSKGAYRSGDLDLITYETVSDHLTKTMEAIGFKKIGMHFRHPKCHHLYVQSVSGPLGIGDDLHIRPRSIEVEGKEIKLLTPTDCIRDRLSAYIFDKARACLTQAALVATSQPHNSRKVKAWLSAEGFPSVYKEFIDEIHLLKKSFSI